MIILIPILIRESRDSIRGALGIVPARRRIRCPPRLVLALQCAGFPLFSPRNYPSTWWFMFISTAGISIFYLCLISFACRFFFILIISMFFLPFSFVLVGFFKFLIISSVWDFIHSFNSSRIHPLLIHLHSLLFPLFCLISLRLPLPFLSSA